MNIEEKGAVLELRNQIKAFILDNFMIGRRAEELADSDSLLSKGILDSTGVLELVGFLEENYGIKVEDEELIPQNLDSVNNLVEYIQDKSRRA